ncbi:TD and POZ domain-containing protein 4 [Trichonephila clavipes]|nr:TD and POZ domain-containing protein 4 [Trichonephila clavipes]
MSLDGNKLLRARTEIPVEECNFQWCLKNFRYYVYKVGAKLISPPFMNRSSLLTTWNLTIYPNGKEKDESAGKIGIYLTRTSRDTSAHFATFRLIILGTNAANNRLVFSICSRDQFLVAENSISSIEIYCL